MSRNAPLRPGDAVRVSSAAASPHRGRTGLVVASRGDVVSVRFSAVRSYDFAAQDLTRVLGGVR